METVYVCICIWILVQMLLFISTKRSSQIFVTIKTHMNISGRSISPVICLSKMRCTWSRHIMRCWSRDEEINAPQKMWWRSFLRWGTVKVKILMIRFETKTWLMENQVKLSSSGDMTAVILTLTWSKSLQIWKQRDSWSTSWSWTFAQLH